MDSSSRALLRLVAKGIPFVVAPFGGLLISGFSGCGPCNQPPPVETTHVITRAQHDELIVEGMLVQEACVSLCARLRAGDAGVSDAGPPVSDGTNTSCALDRIEPDEILTCTTQRWNSCIGGRRPQGFVDGARTRRDVGAWLADVARLEAASVPAFEELALDLTMHGAPAHLVRAAHASADDERHHARMVTELALRFGAHPAAVDRTQTRPRSLEALAIDNAVEGCGREAFGAVVAAHQAAFASDSAVRAVFRTIARDEARHALLSFEIHDWAIDSLGARDRLESARRDALDQLAAATIEPTEAERTVLGLPDAARSVELLAALAA